MSGGISGGSMAGGAAGDGLLALLQNPEAIRQRLEQLKEAEGRANEVIALAGPASEIVQIRESLERTREETDKILVEASTHAATLAMDAEVEAGRIVAEARQRAGKMASEAEAMVVAAGDLMKEASATQAEASKDRQALQVRANELNGVEDTLRQKADVLASRAQELEEQMVKFTRLGELIQAAL